MDSTRLYTTRLINQNFGMGIDSHDLILPLYNFHGTNYFRPWRLCTENNDREVGSSIDNTKDKFKITLDVQHFQPSEISVKSTDNEIVIEAKHEERQDDHGFISRQFLRRYALPKDCKSDSVTSTLSSDGVLTVMANKLPVNDNIKERIVPIKMCGPCPKKEDAIPTETMKNGTSHKEKENGLENIEKQIRFKEDHCRLLKSELLKEPVSGTEKLLSESRKETDELMKLISSDKTAPTATNMTTGKLEEALDHCKAAITELTEKVGETSIATSSETSSLKSSLLSEILESSETSSISKSSISMTSSMKSATEKTNEVLISTGLRETAEII